MTDSQVALEIGRHPNFVGYLRKNNRNKYKDIFERCENKIKSSELYSEEVQKTKMVLLELASTYPTVYKDFVRQVYKNNCYRHHLTMDNFLILPKEDNVFATYRTVLKARQIVNLYKDFVQANLEILKGLE